MDLISFLLYLLQIIIQYVLNVNQQQSSAPLATTTYSTLPASLLSTLNSNLANSTITTPYAFYSSILATMTSDQSTLNSNLTNSITSTPNTSYSNSNVTIAPMSEKVCPSGFLGNNCEIECGITNFEQNQKIVGGNLNSILNIS